MSQVITRPYNINRDILTIVHSMGFDAGYALGNPEPTHNKTTGEPLRVYGVEARENMVKKKIRDLGILLRAAQENYAHEMQLERFQNMTVEEFAAYKAAQEEAASVVPTTESSLEGQLNAAMQRITELEEQLKTARQKQASHKGTQIPCTQCGGKTKYHEESSCGGATSIKCKVCDHIFVP